MRRATKYVAAVISATALSSVASLSLAENVEVAQLPQGDPAKKLAALHAQEVLLERIVKGACYFEAGVAPQKNVTLVGASVEHFERTLPDIEAEIAKLDPKVPANKRLQRSFSKKKDQWYRMRIVVDQIRKGNDADHTRLGQLALMETGITKAIERTFKAVKKSYAKAGEVALGDMLQEQLTFARIFRSETMAKEICMVTMNSSDPHERMLLMDAVVAFEKDLDSDEISALAPPAIKAMIPAWREVMPAVRALAETGKGEAGLLEKIDALKEKWIEAAGGVPLGTAQM